MKITFFLFYNSIDNVSRVSECQQEGFGRNSYFPNIFTTRGRGIQYSTGTHLSGKTSIMRLMAGLDKPQSGNVFFNEKDVTGVEVQKRNVAMVYQQFINFPNFTVYDNIASPLRVKKLSHHLISQKVSKVADLLKLTPYLQRKPMELSGGQQQRTALARPW